MDFLRVAAILNKRKWFLLLSVLVATVLTYGATRLVGSKWSGTVQFVSTTTTNDGTQENSGPSMDPKSQATIYNAIVKSENVLRPSLEQLHLKQLPPDIIEFTPITSRLFQLQITDSNMQRAKSLSNALADNFVIEYHRIRTDQAQKTVDLLESQMKDVNDKLNSTRQKLDTYRTAHNIISTLSSTLDSILASLRADRMRQDDTAQKQFVAQARLTNLQAQIDKLPPTIPIPMSVNATVELKQMQNQLAQMDEKLVELRKHYTDRMTPVKRALDDRQTLAAKLEVAQKVADSTQPNPALLALNQQANSLRQEIVGEEAMATTLATSITKSEQELDHYKGLDGTLGELLSDVTVQSEARSNLMVRIHNAHMQYDIISYQDPITIMSRVSDFNPPVNITQGHSLKLVAMGAFCALIAMCGVVIGMDSIDRRVKTVKEAQIVLPAPILAAIPQPMGKVTYASLARTTELHPQSIHSEAYRFLALHLLMPGMQHVRSLMMLSAKAEQGSTTAITNLGITLAQAGKRVVIIDANVRTAEMHKVFGLKNDFGYSDLLEKPDIPSLERALHETGIPGLWVITSGPQPVNPWKSFRSPNMLEVAQQLGTLADYVLYDTPSSLIFTDALNLAPVVQAAFLCVRALEPVTGAEDRLVAMLKQVDVPVLGCVLNDVPAAVVEGFQNYQHYYGPQANSNPGPGVVREKDATADDMSTASHSWIQLPSGEADNKDEDADA